MILPAGKSRQMESQEYLHKEPSSHKIVEAMLRKSAALDITRSPSEMANTLSAPPQAPLSEGPPNVQGQPPQENVQNTMNDSNNPGMNSQNIETVPAEQFLGTDPEKNKNPQTDILTQEEAQIRKFIGDKFGLGTKQNDDGSITVRITPPSNRQISNPGKFVATLMGEYLKGSEKKDIQAPAAGQPGPIIITYVPAASFKVRKP